MEGKVRKGIIGDGINTEGIECIRTWTSYSGAEFKLPEKHCVFCEKSTDIFWDYSNGPYMILCEEDNVDLELGYRGKCPCFEECKDE